MLVVTFPFGIYSWREYGMRAVARKRKVRKERLSACRNSIVQYSDKLLKDPKEHLAHITVLCGIAALLPS